MNFKEILDTIVKWLSTEGVRVAIGFVVAFILFKIINLIARSLEKRLEKKHVDKLIQNAVVSVTRKVLKAFVLLMLLGYLGLETSSIAAGITSLGVALGLALQGSLSNLAGGLILLITRPFKIGDYIESNGVSGTVELISIYYTNIVTPDNKEIMIPNGSLANGVITNYTKKSIRRLDMTFSIAYENDFNKAKEIILDCIEKTNMALSSPAPFVNVSNHNASSIDIVMRLWCDGKKYWDIHFMLLESVKLAFDANGISIPYQKLDVNLNNHE